MKLKSIISVCMNLFFSYTLVCSSTINYSNSLLINDSLFTESFLIIDSENHDEVLIEAIREIDRFNWKEAKFTIGKYLQKNQLGEDQISVLFYLAKSKFNLGEYAYAADIYNKFIFLTEGRSSLKEQAEWERALCHLEFDPSKAANYFRIIANTQDHASKKDAKAILRLL